MAADPKYKPGDVVLVPFIIKEWLAVPNNIACTAADLVDLVQAARDAQNVVGLFAASLAAERKTSARVGAVHERLAAVLARFEEVGR